MNPVENQNPQKSPGVAPANPKVNPSKPNQDQAQPTRRKFSIDEADVEQENEKQDEKKRYDEADPNWVEPDVEM